MMKTRKLIIATLWIAVAGFVWSCNDSDVKPENPQENLFANNILSNSNSALSRARGLGFGGPVGAIFGNFSGGLGGRAAESSPVAMLRSMNNTSSDTTDQTPSCVTESWEDDGNGNYTFTLDFGDGCDYYGEFMKGKMVEVGSYSDNSFSSNVTYTDFGGTDWSIDGTYKFSGTWEDQTEQSGTEPEDSIWMFDATYTFEADIMQEYTEYGYDEDSEVSTGEQIITVDYEAVGEEEMDENGYTVKTKNESVSISTGDSYTTQVDAPLHFNYTCEGEIWVYVSGVESGTYTEADATVNYSIDYGDGTCDNIIVVTENGVSEEIDLGDAWEEWEEECGEGHND